MYYYQHYIAHPFIPNGRRKFYPHTVSAKSQGRNFTGSELIRNKDGSALLDFKCMRRKSSLFK